MALPTQVLAWLPFTILVQEELLETMYESVIEWATGT
jgi:hypothetical protein